MDNLSERQTGREQTRLSDQFGRIFRFLDYGDKATIQLQKEGYLPQTLACGCRPGEPFALDRIVTLEKKP